MVSQLLDQAVPAMFVLGYLLAFGYLVYVNVKSRW